MKLTQQEAQLVLNEAYRLKADYAIAKPRLGQSIWWCTADDSLLKGSIVYKLEKLLSDNQLIGVDFFYTVDDNQVLDKFYEHFVEQGL
jgi:hypothetical protein